MTIGNLPAVQSQFLGLVSGRVSGLVSSQLAAIERPEGLILGAPPAGMERMAPMPAEQAPPSIRHPLFREALEWRAFEGLDVTVVGRGEVGDKARQLIEKTAWLRAMGFATPPRYVLAEGFFDGFFRENGLGADLRSAGAGPDVVQRILDGTFSRAESAIIAQLSAFFPGAALAVRSSAKGDARGTGTYESKFCGSDSERLTKALRTVLASYFSPGAVVFRRQAATGEGFAVIIEPVVGEMLSREEDDSSFGPVLSGTGYTSTSRGEGYVKVVPGLGGGVDSRKAEVLMRSKLLPAGGMLGEYIVEEHDRILTHSSYGGSFRHSSLLRTDTRSRHWDEENPHPFSAQVLEQDEGRWYLISEREVVYKKELELSIDDLQMLPLFELMRELEARFGRPQYFEWALTFPNGQPRWWITQIADVDPKLDLMEFGDLGRAVYMGHSVIGAGEKRCKGIAFCWDPNDVAELARFNETHQDYLCLYSSRLTTSFLEGVIRRIGLEDISNASVLLEIQDAGHSSDPLSHFGGALDMTRKFFAVRAWRKDLRDDHLADLLERNQDVLEEKVRRLGRMAVYDVPVRVIASERQNLLAVFLDDDPPAKSPQPKEKPVKESSGDPFEDLLNDL